MTSTPPGQLQAQPPPTTGSQTQTQTFPPQTTQQTGTRTQAVLRLRGAHPAGGPSVRWRDDVVDNEGLGRKKSKVCCIYHRPKGVDESSDESSSSSDSSDSDSDSNKESGPSKAEGSGKNHSHGHDCDGHHHHHGRGRGDGARRRKRRPSPNAYEKMPKNKPRDDSAGGQEPSGSQRVA